MRTDAPAADSKLSHEMSELVEKGALDLLRTKFPQPGIEFDERLVGEGQPSRAPQSRTPLHAQLRCNLTASDAEKELCAAGGERSITPARHGDLRNLQL
jgi:hypothetical protein